VVSSVVPGATAGGNLRWVCVGGPRAEVRCTFPACGRPSKEEHVVYLRLLYEGDGGVKLKKAEDAHQAVLDNQGALPVAMREEPDVCRCDEGVS
jgi:hypothetical protein